MPSTRRLERETRTAHKMIALHCRAHHDAQGKKMCSDCRALANYAAQRVARCPFGADKPTCAQCPVHCYRPDRRQAIRRVMRYAGPRMLVHNPLLALLHLLDTLRQPPRRG